MATAEIDGSTLNSHATSAGTFANLRDSFKRVLSPERSRAETGTGYSPTSPTDRSRSRGREFQSTGRGGAGNIVRSESVSRTRDDEIGQERGREILPAHKITHSGRGGAGNIRSPSRDVEADMRALSREREIIEDHRRNEEGQIHSTGRGGYGNMDRSRSRSREPSKTLHSSGRGGFGNISTGDGNGLENLEEEERAHHAHVPGFHSSGRGGAGNFVAGAPPAPEHITPSPSPATEGAQWRSSGRGGAGNMKPVHPTDPHGAAEEARGRREHTGLGGFIDRLTTRSRDPQNRDH